MRIAGRARLLPATTALLVTAMLAAAALPVAAPAPALAGGYVEPWSLVGGPTAAPAISYGGYSEGCLAGGEALPLDGPGYQVVRPNWRRYYGNPILIDFLRHFGQQVEDASIGIVQIADLSQPRGGPILGHVSHENGLDADIWFRLDTPRMPPEDRNGLRDDLSMVDAATGAVDPERWTDAQAEMVRLAADDPRVARVFVNRAIKDDLCARDWDDRQWLRFVQPWRGHTGHMHVRLHCPDGDRHCEGQFQPPEGTGCPQDGQEWTDTGERNAMYGSPGMPRPPGLLPPRCLFVYEAGTAR